MTVHLLSLQKLLSAPGGSKRSSISVHLTLPCGSSRRSVDRPSNLISRKLLHCRCHILKCRRFVFVCNCPRAMTADCVPHARFDTCARRQSLERVSPPVKWRKPLLRNTQAAHPMGEALSCQYRARRLSFLRFRFARIVRRDCRKEGLHRAAATNFRKPCSIRWSCSGTTRGSRPFTEPASGVMRMAAMPCS